jgi:chromosome partitioning protein
MKKVYTVVNQKGGVGKTTTAINLGAYLGELGQRVLLIDLDPQANATSCLGIERSQLAAGTYEVLIGQKDASECILHNAKFKLSLLPSTPNLAGAEIELIDLPQRHARLQDIIRVLQGRYDYILIDCPPSLGLLTLNGLVAAQDGVIIPVQCEFLALEGLGMLTQTLERVREGLYPPLQIRGVLLTMFDSRTNLANDVVQEVRHYFEGKTFQTIIPRNIRLAEAPSFGMPITHYAPDSAGGNAYRQLAEELLREDTKDIHQEEV